MNEMVLLSSKCQSMPGRDVSKYFEEPKTEKFVVMEMFNSTVGFGLALDKDSSSSSSSFCYKLLDRSYSGIQGLKFSEKVHQEEKGKSESEQTVSNELKFSDKVLQEENGKSESESTVSPKDCSGIHDLKSSEKVHQKENGKSESTLSSKDCSGFHELKSSEKVHQEENRKSESETSLQDCSDVQEIEKVYWGNGDSNSESAISQDCHEVELQTANRAGYETENWMSSFLEKLDAIQFEDEEDFDDDDYIELDPGCGTVEGLQEREMREEPACTMSWDVNTDKDEDELELELMKGCGNVEELQEQEMREGASCEEPSRANSWDLSADEDEETDVLLEHENLVQQMKMELKACKMKGLPTISEECESPRTVEYLQPLNIDHKIEYKDIMDQIHKFHKIYIERMRKLDIFNYQTLHAISFLQLKAFTTGNREADPVPKIWPWKEQRVYADPMHKSIAEMHRDLELIYVGQLCLSWEILCWLDVKAHELMEYDSRGNHSYNRAVDEFQQFQVLMQRFLEDEPFQGQRIQNYVKTRCIVRSLLQVPTIRDDCLKTKKEIGANTVSLQQLVETIKEAMVVFREFVLVDKKSTKGVKETKVDPVLVMDVITKLHQKERNFREQIKSEKCIVKKMKKKKKQQNCGEVLRCEVELRLVSRVISLCRLRNEQLVWCQNKLKNINFARRKVHVEPSFLLFPC